MYLGQAGRRKPDRQRQRERERTREIDVMRQEHRQSYGEIEIHTEIKTDRHRLQRVIEKR